MLNGHSGELLTDSFKTSDFQGNCLSERVWEPPKHHPTLECTPSGERQGPLPGVRVHGDGPASRDKEGKHPEGDPQTIHHVSAVQGKRDSHQNLLDIIFDLIRQPSSYIRAM